MREHGFELLALMCKKQIRRIELGFLQLEH